MANVFAIKKHGAFILCGMLPVMLFFIGIMTFDFVYAMIFMIVGVFLSDLLATKLMAHPQLEVLEGKGLRVLTLDSTGMIKIFLAKVRKPFIDLFVGGKEPKTSVFDRNTVSYWANPGKAEMSECLEKKELKQIIRDEAGNPIEEKIIGYETDLFVVLKIPKKDIPGYTFAFEASPCLVYNGIVGELYTKEMLGTLETKLFVQHLVLYLNRKVNELVSLIRDFTRYIVEQTRPKPSIFANKWVWLIVAVFVVILILAFLPQVLKSFSGLELPGLPSAGLTPK